MEAKVRPLSKKTIARLRRVVKAILTHAERVDMEGWYHSSVHNFETETATVGCNTVGCFGGWCCFLSTPNNLPGTPSVQETASKYLGLDTGRASKIFFPGRWPPAYEKTLDQFSPQTPEYAAVIAARIEHFIQTNGQE